MAQKAIEQAKRTAVRAVQVLDFATFAEAMRQLDEGQAQPGEAGDAEGDKAFARRTFEAFAGSLADNPFGGDVDIAQWLDALPEVASVDAADVFIATGLGGPLFDGMAVHRPRLAAQIAVAMLTRDARLASGDWQMVGRLAKAAIADGVDMDWASVAAWLRRAGDEQAQAGVLDDLLTLARCNVRSLDGLGQARAGDTGARRLARLVKATEGRFSEAALARTSAAALANLAGVVLDALAGGHGEEAVDEASHAPLAVFMEEAAKTLAKRAAARTEGDAPLLPAVCMRDRRALGERLKALAADKATLALPLTGPLLSILALAVTEGAGDGRRGPSRDLAYAFALCGVDLAPGPNEKEPARSAGVAGETPAAEPARGRGVEALAEAWNEVARAQDAGNAEGIAQVAVEAWSPAQQAAMVGARLLLPPSAAMLEALLAKDRQRWRIWAAGGARNLAADALACLLQAMEPRARAETNWLAGRQDRMPAISARLAEVVVGLGGCSLADTFMALAWQTRQGGEAGPGAARTQAWAALQRRLGDPAQARQVPAFLKALGEDDLFGGGYRGRDKTPADLRAALFGQMQACLGALAEHPEAWLSPESARALAAPGKRGNLALEHLASGLAPAHAETLRVALDRHVQADPALAREVGGSRILACLARDDAKPSGKWGHSHPGELVEMWLAPCGVADEVVLRTARLLGADTQAYWLEAMRGMVSGRMPFLARTHIGAGLCQHVLGRMVQRGAEGDPRGRACMVVGRAILAAGCEMGMEEAIGGVLRDAREGGAAMRLGMHWPCRLGHGNDFSEVAEALLEDPALAGAGRTNPRAVARAAEAAIQRVKRGPTAMRRRPS